ncbi:MAG: tetratricopeptide repeat protein [Nitratireductor sp.]
MNRFMRAIMLVAVTSLPLAGCNTTGTSTHSTDDTITSSLGVDGNGNRIDADGPASPWSNQVSLKGDKSARLVELGKESFRDANYGLSEKYFRQAVEIRADNVAAWVGLAASYDQLGRFDNADRAYDQLAKMKGDDPRILNNRGYSYLLRGDYKKASAFFNRAQSKDPTLEETQGNLQLLDQVRNS